MEITSVMLDAIFAVKGKRNPKLWTLVAPPTSPKLPQLPQPPKTLKKKWLLPWNSSKKSSTKLKTSPTA